MQTNLDTYADIERKCVKDDFVERFFAENFQRSLDAYADTDRNCVNRKVLPDKDQSLLGAQIMKSRSTENQLWSTAFFL